jgi:hypothetical protein
MIPSMFSAGLGAAQVQSFPSIAGLAARYRADTLTKDGSNLVSPWTDISGNGRDLTEATNKPLWVASQVNGQPIVRFDGVNDKLKSGAFSIAGPHTLAMVFKYSSGSVSFSTGATSAPEIYQNVKLAKSGTVGPSVVGTAAFQLALGIAQAGSCTIALNNGSDVGGSDVSGTAVEVCLGARSDLSSFGAVDIAEAVLIAGVISAGERAALLAYVQSYYGLW